MTLHQSTLRIEPASSIIAQTFQFGQFGNKQLSASWLAPSQLSIGYWPSRRSSDEDERLLHICGVTVYMKWAQPLTQVVPSLIGSRCQIRLRGSGDLAMISPCFRLTRAIFLRRHLHHEYDSALEPWNRKFDGAFEDVKGY
jgi:hypothetical protein